MAELLTLVKRESDCDKVLTAHIGEMEQVLIIGQTKSGEFVAACDGSVDIERLIVWMRRTEHKLQLELDELDNADQT